MTLAISPGITLAICAPTRTLTVAIHSPRLPWFEELVAGSSKMRGYLERPMSTLEDTRRWLRTQAAPSLATLIVAADGDTSPLLELATQGLPRMTARQRAMIAAENAESA